ncbi:MAG: hypothetical protein DKM22_04245 [Candidatus Melainabacteria bacterium]|nr:MAG: hypothetical protein DKM22_04245 [Candidatus Melainabacteria bacterium]
MCSPKTPAPVASTAATEPIATPTYADAEVQKAGEVTRQQQQAQTNRNIKSTALGVTEDATTKKKTLLGE